MDVDIIVLMIFLVAGMLGVILASALLKVKKKKDDNDDDILGI